MAKAIPVHVRIDGTTDTRLRVLKRHDDAVEHIRKREAFRSSTNGFSGRHAASHDEGLTGDLPASAEGDYLDALKGYGDKLYVIRSYATPIAWVGPGDHELTIPAVQYSQTTTQHQCIVRHADGKTGYVPYETHGLAGGGRSPYGRGGLSAAMYP